MYCLGTRYELSVSALTRSEMFGSPSLPITVDSVATQPHIPQILRIKVLNIFCRKINFIDYFYFQSLNFTPNPGILLQTLGLTWSDFSLNLLLLKG